MCKIVCYFILFFSITWVINDLVGQYNSTILKNVVDLYFGIILYSESNLETPIMPSV